MGLRKFTANVAHCDASSSAMPRVSVSRTVVPGCSLAFRAVAPMVPELAQLARNTVPASHAAIALVRATEEPAVDRIDVALNRGDLAADGVDDTVNPVHHRPRTVDTALDALRQTIDAIQQNSEALAGRQLTELTDQSGHCRRQI